MITRNILVAFACLLPASLHALEPRIVKPTLDDSEVVVADLVLTDKPYSADPTGKNDNTPILQKAIDDIQAYPPTVSRSYMAVLYYNLTFYNSYEGMSCVHAGGIPTHENVYGTFLKRGIFNDKNLEYGFIHRLHISPRSGPTPRRS